MNVELAELEAFDKIASIVKRTAAPLDSTLEILASVRMLYVEMDRTECFDLITDAMVHLEAARDLLRKTITK